MSRLELDRVRETRSARRVATRRAAEPGSPAMVGRVVSPASAIGVKKFLLVKPVAVLGAECEGCSPALTVGAATIPVLLLGPRLPATGDDLVCRFVNHRWVAEKTGGGGAGIPYGCFLPTVFCRKTIAQVAEATVIVAATGPGSTGQGIVLTADHYTGDGGGGSLVLNLRWRSTKDPVATGSGGTIYREIIFSEAACFFVTSVYFTYADGTNALQGGLIGYVGEWACVGPDGNQIGPPFTNSCLAVRGQTDSNGTSATTYVYFPGCSPSNPYSTPAPAADALAAPSPMLPAATSSADASPDDVAALGVDTLASLDPDFAAELAAARPADAATLRLVAAAQGCPHRTAPACRCPAVPGTCARGKGGATGVTLADCVACQRDDAATILGHLSGYTGYGQLALEVGRSLEALGYPVAFEAIDRDDGGYVPLDYFIQERSAR